MKQALRRRFGTDLTVVLEEEAGYRRWVWFPNMSLLQLVQWWTDRDNVSRFVRGCSPEKLPGDLYLVEDEDELWISGYRRPDCCKAWINHDFDSFLITPAKELILDPEFPLEYLESARRMLANYLD